MTSDTEGPAGAGRHLASERIQEYLRTGTPGTVRVAGSPMAYLVIDPPHRRLAIQVPANGPLPEVGRYERLAAVTVERGGKRWHELRMDGADRLTNLYPLLCLILDQVQLHGAEFAAAVDEALRIYGSVLDERMVLSDTQQIGLVGELLALEHLFGSIGPDSALAAWCGPDAAEHDFSLPLCDVELKTTTSEARHHWISSATQLTSRPDRGLYLVSIQVTSAGAAPGWSLPSLVEEVRVSALHRQHNVDLELRDRGYRDTDADLYDRRWALRSPPACYLVDDDFPALTPDRIAAAVPHAHRLLEYRYRLDLTGFATTSMPTDLAGLLNGWERT